MAPQLAASIGPHPEARIGPAPAETLGADDYQALFGLLTSEDATARKQGQTLATKLTPPEQRAFFDYQQQTQPRAGEATRVDNSVLGMPPEMAALSGAAVGSAVLRPAVNMGGRAVAGVKAMAEQATPVLKYELAKTTLEKMGVPAPLAMAAAMAISGYRGNGKPAVKGPAAAEATAAASAAETSPVAAAPAAPSTVASAPPPPASTAGPLTTQEADTVDALVKQGYRREDVLAHLAQHRASSTPPPAAPPPAPTAAGAAKPTLLAAEAKEYLRLLKAGTTHADAMRLIEQQRAFLERMNLPTSEATRRSVVDRNATGHWPEE